jgi:hypothetical protein
MKIYHHLKNNVFRCGERPLAASVLNCQSRAGTTPVDNVPSRPVKRRRIDLNDFIEITFAKKEKDHLKSW